MGVVWAFRILEHQKEHFRNGGEVPKKTGGQGRGGGEGETWTNGREGKYTWQNKSTEVLGSWYFLLCADRGKWAKLPERK